jgi:hypothetical protein
LEKVFVLRQKEGKRRCAYEDGEYKKKRPTAKHTTKEDRRRE